MGLNWSKQCSTARDRPAADRMAAAETSVYLLVSAFAAIALCSFVMLVRHLRAPVDLWKRYGRFLGLLCAGNLLGSNSEALLLILQSAPAPLLASQDCPRGLQWREKTDSPLKRSFTETLACRRCGPTTSDCNSATTFSVVFINSFRQQPASDSPRALKL